MHKKSLLILPLIYYLRLQLSDIIAFTAKDLRPFSVSQLFLSYGQQVVLEGLPFELFERRSLPLFPSVCRNTDIVQIFLKEGKPQVLKYVWTHRTIRPWGEFLPVQCERCYCTCSWVSVFSPDSSCLFSCLHCSKKFKFKRPGNIKWLGDEVAGGRWMVAAPDT